jgi:hypothetical protein
MDSRIVQYYRLNALRNVKNRPLPLVDMLERKAVDIAMSKSGVMLLYNDVNGLYYVKEDVIGGKQKKMRVDGENTLPPKPIVIL